MRASLLASLALAMSGCIADPADYPFKPLPDAGTADVRDRPDAMNEDVGEDIGEDAEMLPPVPMTYDCADPSTSCEPFTCDGSCEVSCLIKDATCSVACDTDERCRLKCSGNVDSCAMEQCDDPTPCGKGWVCNGEC